MIFCKVYEVHKNMKMFSEGNSINYFYIVCYFGIFYKLFESNFLINSATIKIILV